MREYPQNIDYNEALQIPDLAFTDPDLKQCEFVRKGRRLKCSSGGFAIVYKAQFGNGSFQAVRLFTKPADEREERYEAISDHLNARQLRCLVKFGYEEKGIQVSSKAGQYPVVTMEWVEGRNLKSWIGDCCQSRQTAPLEQAAELWRELIRELRDNDIAHGDLQHGNVLVTDGPELKLVDYDGMTVPKLVGRPNLEFGYSGYQHPDRGDDTVLSPELDNFPSLVIYVSLLILAREPSLWDSVIEQHLDDYALLFTEDDYLDPDGSELFRQLLNHRDAEIVKWASKLREALTFRLEDCPPLESFLDPFESVAEAVDARDWDRAVTEFDRVSGVTPDPSLAQTIDAARKKVAHRIELEQLYDRGSEQALAKVYDAALLQDYPAASQIAKRAAESSRIAPIVERLQTAIQRKDLRELVAAWDAQGSLLDARPSGDRFRQPVTEARNRNALCDEVLQHLASAEKQPVPKLKSVHDQLTKLGGHPEIANRSGEISTAISRTNAFGSVPDSAADPSLTRDETFEQSWNESLFAGWPVAEAVRSDYENALNRLTQYRQIQPLLQSGTVGQIQSEQAIASCTLPAGYDQALDDRRGLAVDRVGHLQQARTLLGHPGAREKQLAAAWRTLQGDGLDQLLTKEETDRLRLSVERTKLIKQLQGIPPETRRFERDDALLRIWQPKLLDHCGELTELKEEYETALRRRDLLNVLEDARSSQDHARISRVFDDPLLSDLELPPDLAKLRNASRRSMRDVNRVLNALKQDDQDAFLEAFDPVILDGYWSMIEPFRDQIEQWIQEGLFSRERIGLLKPMMGHGLRRMGKQLQLRWRWPKGKIAEKCLVTFSRVQFRRPAELDEGAVQKQFTVTQKSFEDGGGGRLLGTTTGLDSRVVTVWAIIEFGGQTYYSEPLTLGRS